MTISMMFWYVLTGIFAGTMSGMLGLGGGIVVVPALAALFLYNPDISNELHMRMAIGTSLAIMIITLASSLYAHHMRKTVNWLMAKTVFPGLFIGIIIGTALVCFLPSSFLSRLFSVFLLFIIVHMLFFNQGSLEEYQSSARSPMMITGFSALIGVLSSLLGVGGGTMWVPFFLYCKLPMHDAVGTSVACGMMASVIATVGFISAGFFTDIYVPYSTSYIYWPAFLGVAMASVIFAPIGVYLAYKLSARLLKYVFALLLFIMAIQMMFFMH